MAWSKNYTQPTNVNGGNEYQKGDQLLKEDLNAIINNVLYIGEQLKVQDYNASTEYKLFNIVRYAENGHAYMYINATASTGTLPTNTTYWKLLVEKGDKGDKGDKGISFRFLGNWDSGTSYVSNADYIDCVYANGGMYGCILDNSNQSPPNETYWALILNGITSISKTDTTGYIDTYTITYSDNSTTTFTVTNANIANTSNILIGDGLGGAVDSGISASTILNTLNAVTTTGNPVNIQNTNDGFVDKVKILNETASAIESPLTGKSVGKNWLDFANATFYDADYSALKFNLNTTQNNIIIKTATEIQVRGGISLAYQGVATLMQMPVGTYKLSAVATILSGTAPVSIRWATYANESDAQNGSLLINQGSDNVPIVITEANQWLIVGCFLNNSDPATTASLTEMQLKVGTTASDYEPYTASAFSIPLKDTSGTVLDLNPADVIEMIDGKYHLNDIELHDDSQDALRSIPTKAGQTNLIGDQPFTFDVTEFQLGLESIDAMLTLPDGTRVNVLTKDRMVYITSGEHKGKTLDYVLQELKNEIDGTKTAIITAIANVESSYDKVIRTQTEFEALIASPTWLDAVSVAFVGQFTLDTTDNSGVKIPSTVKQIHGFNSAKITITNFKYDASTAKGGLWYDTAPTTQDYSIRDLEVSCTGTEGFGFVYCNNLSNCTGTGTGTNGFGFRNCNNLSNCTGIGTGTETYGYGRGFVYCNNLSNCTGTGTGAYGNGFYNINYAVNCKDGGSSTDMWGGTNRNISVETCRKTNVEVDNTTLNA